jgi:hypothetical protein
MRKINGLYIETYKKNLLLKLKKNFGKEFSGVVVILQELVAEPAP